jgi:N-acetylmuramoyl-L-alanine amidase
MKRSLTWGRLALWSVIFCFLPIWVFPQVPQIDVVYPRPRETDSKIVIAVVDSNFVFGSVQPVSGKLSVNGTKVPLYSNGSFFAFLPVPKRTQTYKFHFESADGKVDTAVSFLFLNQVKVDSPAVPKFHCPTLVRFLPGYNVTRNDINGTYDLFPIEDTQVLAVMQKGNFLKIQLTDTRSTWVETQFVEEIPGKVEPKSKAISRIDCQLETTLTRIIIPDVGRPLFRLEDFQEPDEVRLTLYGVISHLDLIKSYIDDPILERVAWEQPENEVLCIHFYLKHPSWGYQAIWNQDSLEVELKHPPQFRKGMERVVVAIDPGHGGDQHGAIGPTRLEEKDVNLIVARQLQTQLNSAGAIAVLTRQEDETVDLYERIERARQAGADLLISIHHNAFPDGLNPFLKPYGTGTYYYRPQSFELAGCVHESLLKGTDLPDDGLIYDNLALVRPTDFPAVLVEIGYIVLPDQEMQIRNPSFQARSVKMLVRGIKSFVDARRKETE